MKALVLGGSGYVGRAVVSQLLERGDQVMATYHSQKLSGLIPGASWIQLDITDRALVEQALGELDFEVVFHVASLPGDTGNPEEMMRVNVSGFHNILELARAKKVKRLVLTSSISAYEYYPATQFNKPDYLPVDEHHPCRPKDMYALTKRMQELLALTYFHQFGLPITALRLTAVVGPAGRGGGKMWREFAQSLKEGKEVQLPQLSQEEVGHFVDIRDVARMHLALAEHPQASGEIFNCCGLSPTSGKEFATAVHQFYPHIQVKFGFPWSMAQGGVLYFDMSKAKKLVGFEPQYSIADSVRAIKEWIESGGLE